MERLEAVITGRVQMVMYRDFTCRHARKYRIVGEVMNRSDGSVQVIAEAPRQTLELFVKKLHSGSLLSRVHKVVTRFTDATGEFSDFRIVYES